jgi:hypothetical protein
MKLWRWLQREPLVHFLLAGAAIYFLFALLGNRGDLDHRQIVVNRAILLQYMQYRAKAFEPSTFAAQFDALSPDERQKLIDDYVREEALYREAKSLGLEHGDYVMRQRLVQKMNFLLESSINVEPNETQLRQYLDEHQAQYAIAPSMTFTHVFIDSALHGEDKSKHIATELLISLNRRHAGFNDAPQFGDRFPYLQNYVERTSDYIGSQFGNEFVLELQKRTVDAQNWQGPVHSQLGWHLLLITSKNDGRQPSLAELHEQVADDYKRDHVADLQEQATRKLIADYHVHVDLPSKP